MLWDHAIMTYITGIPYFFAFYLSEQGYFSKDYLASFMIFLMMGIYINKDLVGARSIAKRVLGYKLIDKHSGLNASSLQCFMRNMLLPFLWPIEVIVAWYKPEIRIGDRMAGTELIKAEKQKFWSIIRDVPKTLSDKKLGLTLAFSLAYAFVIYWIDIF